GDECTAVVQEDVFGLDVAMHDTPFVRVLQCVSDFARDAYRINHRELMLARESSAQCFSLHVRHHVEKKSVGGARVEQRKNVRMLQIGGKLDLLQKAFGAGNRGELRV